jgi:hypothetical protein
MAGFYHKPFLDRVWFLTVCAKFACIETGSNIHELKAFGNWKKNGLEMKTEIKLKQSKKIERNRQNKTHNNIIKRDNLKKISKCSRNKRVFVKLNQKSSNKNHNKILAKMIDNANFFIFSIHFSIISALLSTLSTILFSSQFSLTGSLLVTWPLRGSPITYLIEVSRSVMLEDRPPPFQWTAASHRDLC